MAALTHKRLCITAWLNSIAEVSLQAKSQAFFALLVALLGSQ